MALKSSIRLLVGCSLLLSVVSAQAATLEPATGCSVEAADIMLGYPPGQPQLASVNVTGTAHCTGEAATMVKVCVQKQISDGRWRSLKCRYRTETGDSASQSATVSCVKGTLFRGKVVASTNSGSTIVKSIAFTPRARC